MAHLASSGFPAWVKQRSSFLLGHTTNTVLTKLVLSRWLDSGLVLFCVFIDRDQLEVNKNAIKKLGQYLAILTPFLVNREEKSRYHGSTISG